MVKAATACHPKPEPIMKINCPHCRQSLEAAAELAGTAATCPTCNGRFEVPALPLPHLPGAPLRNTPKPPGPPPSLLSADKPANADLFKTGLKNMFWGGVLIAMGLTGLFGGSIFTGNADGIDTFFDLLGIFWIIVGICQVCMPKKEAGSSAASPGSCPAGHDLPRKSMSR